MSAAFHQTPFDVETARDAWDHARTYGRPGLGRTITFRNRPLDYAPIQPMDREIGRFDVERPLGLTTLVLIGSIVCCIIFCVALS